MPTEVVRYHRFVHGILGGATVTACALVLAFIAHGLFRQREPWAWRAAAASVAAWFTSTPSVARSRRLAKRGAA